MSTADTAKKTDCSKWVWLLKRTRRNSGTLRTFEP
jgi:hypothetical protein